MMSTKRLSSCSFVYKQLNQNWLPVNGAKRNESNYLIKTPAESHGNILINKLIKENMKITILPRNYFCCGTSKYSSSSAKPTTTSSLQEKTNESKGSLKCNDSQASCPAQDLFGEESKLGLFAKFKLMYKKYWYVLIPVHVVSSIAWVGGFYYLSKR